MIFPKQKLALGISAKCSPERLLFSFHLRTLNDAVFLCFICPNQNFRTSYYFLFNTIYSWIVNVNLRFSNNFD